MTRKDFILLAEALKLARVRGDYAHDTHMLAGVDRAAEKVADALAAENPRFDRARFLKACGVQS